MLQQNIAVARGEPAVVAAAAKADRRGRRSDADNCSHSSRLPEAASSAAARRRYLPLDGMLTGAVTVWRETPSSRRWPGWLAQFGHFQFANETLTAHLWLGGGLITLANILIQRDQREPART